MNNSKKLIYHISLLSILIGYIITVDLLLSLGISNFILYVTLSIVFLILLVFISKRKFNLILSYISLLIIYIFIEFISQIYALNHKLNYISKEVETTNMFGYFNEKSLNFDSIRGFKWLPGTHRNMKMNNNLCIFDACFQVNNFGCISKFPYSNSKAKKRYIVFGDSFTACSYLRNSWTDLFQDKINKEIELYNFGIDAAGIKNWYKSYFQEIQNMIEYDGVIFAVFGNDLDRSFCMMHQDSIRTYLGYTDNNIVSFDKKLFNEFSNNIISDKILDSLKSNINIKIEQNHRSKLGLISGIYIYKIMNILYENFKHKKMMNNFYTNYESGCFFRQFVNIK